jgi:hypothetical protein
VVVRRWYSVPGKLADKCRGITTWWSIRVATLPDLSPTV